MSTDALHRSVQSSELSRNSASVFAAAEAGPVTITRRDGEDFILATASDARREHRAMEIAAGLIAASLAGAPPSLPERLRGPFPWIEFLSDAERMAFADEIVRVMRACAAVGDYRQLLITFHAWRSTAEAYAHGLPHDEALHWLDSPVSVPRPTLE